MGLTVWQGEDGSGPLRGQDSNPFFPTGPATERASPSRFLAHALMGPVMAAPSTSCGKAWPLVRSAQLTTTTLSSAAVWLGSRCVSRLRDFPGEEGTYCLSGLFSSPTEDDVCVARTQAMHEWHRPA